VTQFPLAMRARCALRWLLATAAAAVPLWAENGPAVAAEDLSPPDFAAWRLYTYTVPLVSELGVAPAAAARYWSMLAADYPSLPWDNGGVSHYLVRDLPRVMPAWTPPRAMERGDMPWDDDGRVIYLLPLAPYVLCAATDFWGANFSNPLMHAKGGFARWRGSGSMYRAQTHCLRNETLTCPTYERALAWLVDRPSWRAREHRHVFVLLGAEVPRVAYACDVRRATPLAARSVYSRVATSILVTTEGRRWSWRLEREQGFLVTTPQWWPPFFMYNGSGAELPAFKRDLVVMKSVAAKFCHRYDDQVHPTRLWCADRGTPTPDPFKARAALVHALRARRGAAPRTYHTGRASFMEDPRAFMADFANAYQHATFTLVPHGDTVTSSRIYQAVGALSIPVFLVERDHLPFQSLVPWRDISLYVDPDDVITWSARASALGGGGADARGDAPNPLDVLQQLVEREPERLRAMQRSLAEVRWHLLYHAGDHVATPYEAHEPLVTPGMRPSAARSVAHELVVAAHRRQLAHVAGRPLPLWLTNPREAGAPVGKRRPKRSAQSQRSREADANAAPSASHNA